MTRGLVALLGFCVAARMAVAGDAVPDDVGDEASEATVITPGVSALNRAIEWDVDHDWYVFSARPWIDYTITVATGTIWDCEVKLLMPPGVALLRYTNTAAGVSAQLVYAATGSAVRVFLDVHGLVEFTTGTYSVAVSQALVDTNTNGLPDGWEMIQFGSLTNTPGGDFDLDGFRNEDEYLAGTLANTASSALKLTRLTSQTNTTLVTWQAVPNAAYRLYEGIQAGSVWSPRSPDVVASSNSVTVGAGFLVTSQVYRVDLVY